MYRKSAITSRNTAFDFNNISLLKEKTASQKSLSGKIETLNELGHHYLFFFRISDSIACFNESIRLATIAEDEIEKAIALRNLSLSYGAIAEIEKTAYNIEQSIHILSSLNESVELLNAQCVQSFVYRLKGEYGSAITLMNEVLHKALHINDSDLLLEVYLELSAVHTSVRKHDLAEEYALRGLAIAEKNGNEFVSGKLFDIIAATATAQGDYTRAIEFYFRAYNFFEKSACYFHLGTVCFSFTRVYHILGDYDGGLEMINRAKIFFDKANAPENVKQGLLLNESILLLSSERLDDAFETINLFSEENQVGEKRWMDIFFSKFLFGYYHVKRKEYEKALSFYNESLQFSEKAGNNGFYSTVLYETGYCYFLIEHYEKAIEYLQKAVDAFKNQENFIELKRAYRILSEVYSKTGNIEEAFLSLKNYYHFSEIINSPENKTEAIKLLHNFLQEEVPAEVEELRKQNRDLLSELHKKNSELQTLALQLAQKSQIANALRDGIKEQSANIIDAKGFVQRNLDLLNDIEDQKDWEHFNRHFTLQYPEFFIKLTKKSNKLSPIEQKICALLKINLSNQEIADVLFLSKRTVDTHRYNIRKKLNLQSHSSIYEFINTI